MGLDVAHRNGWDTYGTNNLAIGSDVNQSSSRVNSSNKAEIVQYSKFRVSGSSNTVESMSTTRKSVGELAWIPREPYDNSSN